MLLFEEKRLLKSSLSSILATLYFDARLINPSAPKSSHHSELNLTSVKSSLRILKTCFSYVFAFSNKSLESKVGLVLFVPEGSPIRPVKSPIRKMTLCPKS